METVLIVFCILLVLIAYLGIIILYIRQNRLKEVEKTQAKLIEEMEQSIAAFLVQIQEDNEIFLKKVNEIFTNKQSMLKTEANGNEKKIASEVQTNVESDIAKTMINPLKAVAINKYKQTKPIEKKENSASESLFSAPEKQTSPSEELPKWVNDVQSLLEDIQPFNELPISDQIRLLKKQGLNNEEIAKKLKVGKTELELMIKFQSNQ